jgi:hypothetical protein
MRLAGLGGLTVRLNLVCAVKLNSLPGVGIRETDSDWGCDVLMNRLGSSVPGMDWLVRIDIELDDSF